MNPAKFLLNPQQNPTSLASSSSENLSLNTPPSGGPIFLSFVPTPQSDGIVTHHPSPAEYIDCDSSGRLWRKYDDKKLSIFLGKCTPVLLDYYKQHPQDIPGVNATSVQFGSLSTLVELPANYIVLDQIKYKTVPVEGQKLPEVERHDTYIFGHPSGRRFRSAQEFVPHLKWLASDPKLNSKNCNCKYCNLGASKSVSRILQSPNKTTLAKTSSSLKRKSESHEEISKTFKQTKMGDTELKPNFGELWIENNVNLDEKEPNLPIDLTSEPSSPHILDLSLSQNELALNPKETEISSENKQVSSSDKGKIPIYYVDPDSPENNEVTTFSENTKQEILKQNTTDTTPNLNPQDLSKQSLPKLDNEDSNLQTNETTLILNQQETLKENEILSDVVEIPKKLQNIAILNPAEKSFQFPNQSTIIEIPILAIAPPKNVSENNNLNPSTLNNQNHKSVYQSVLPDPTSRSVHGHFQNTRITTNPAINQPSKIPKPFLLPLPPTSFRPGDLVWVDCLVSIEEVRKVIPISDFPNIGLDISQLSSKFVQWPAEVIEFISAPFEVNTHLWSTPIILQNSLERRVRVGTPHVYSNQFPFSTGELSEVMLQPGTVAKGIMYAYKIRLLPYGIHIDLIIPEMCLEPFMIFPSPQQKLLDRLVNIDNPTEKPDFTSLQLPVLTNIVKKMNRETADYLVLLYFTSLTQAAERYNSIKIVAMKTTTIDKIVLQHVILGPEILFLGDAILVNDPFSNCLRCFAVDRLEYSIQKKRFLIYGRLLKVISGVPNTMSLNVWITGKPPTNLLIDTTVNANDTAFTFLCTPADAPIEINLNFIVGRIYRNFPGILPAHLSRKVPRKIDIGYIEKTQAPVSRI
ncbi:hypothetical protein HK096_008778 [Nowakowskiella sp. JEL0078]|nr:hypothetical protein HK096_008778 [Nowakowskiella sp. JEL0078]